MTALTYDLHIHSLLSPCGDMDMTPYNIVAMAALKGLDVIALTDHNSSKNCGAFLYHGKEFGVITIPGMELCTIEEVHVVILFETLSECMDFDKYVECHISKLKNKEEIFGSQIIVNEKDEEIGRVDELLINASNISFFELENLLRPYKAVYIPAHIDKPSNSLISNLGFVPEDSTFTSYEIKSKDSKEKLVRGNPYLSNCNVLYNSDAHYLEHIKEAEDVIYVKERSVRGVIDGLRSKFIID